MKILTIGRTANEVEILLTFDEPIVGDKLQELINHLGHLGEAHCATCQCNRTHPTMPLDVNGNPRKRSWHHD